MCSDVFVAEAEDVDKSMRSNDGLGFCLCKLLDELDQFPKPTVEHCI